MINNGLNSLLILAIKKQHHIVIDSLLQSAIRPNHLRTQTQTQKLPIQFTVYPFILFVHIVTLF